MTIRGYEITARLLAYIIGAVLLVVAVSLFLSQCHSTKTLKKQNEVSQGEAGAAIDSGQAATNALGNVLGNDAATDATVAQGKAEIAAAAAGQKGAAAKRAACRLKAYANSPQCKEQSK